MDIITQLFDCLGSPTDAEWVSHFSPLIRLEKGPSAEVGANGSSFDVDCSFCLGVIVNTWTTFAQRRYSIFIKHGGLDSGVTTFLLQGGAVQLQVSGDFLEQNNLHFALTPMAGAQPDVAINVWLVKVPPPQV